MHCSPHISLGNVEENYFTLWGGSIEPYMGYIGCVIVHATVLQGIEIGGKLINLPASVEDFILH